jgi:acyl dehydratase
MEGRALFSPLIKEKLMAVKAGWEGRYFEDFEVGDIYRSRIGRTLTQAACQQH